MKPQCNKFVANLKSRNIHIHKITANPKKQLTIKNSLAAFVSEDPAIKFTAQRAFISYMRSLNFMQDKEIFNVKSIYHKKKTIN